MYKTKDGEEIFIIDGHVHCWDGSPENQRNIHGAQFIDCFYSYHAALSPKEEVWEREKFYKYGPETMYRDLFVDGPDDMAIFQPTVLGDFYKNGFNSPEQNAVLKEKYPDRFILNGVFDPRDGERGLDGLEALVGKYKLKGVKLYTAEWRGAIAAATSCTIPGRSDILNMPRNSASRTSTSIRDQRSCRSTAMCSMSPMSITPRRISPT